MSLRCVGSLPCGGCCRGLFGYGTTGRHSRTMPTPSLTQPATSTPTPTQTPTAAPVPTVTAAVSPAPTGTPTPTVAHPGPSGADRNSAIHPRGGLRLHREHVPALLRRGPQPRRLSQGRCSRRHQQRQVHGPGYDRDAPVLPGVGTGEIDRGRHLGHNRRKICRSLECLAGMDGVAGQKRRRI